MRAELTATGRARYADGLRVIQVLEQQLQSAYTAHERRLVGRVLAYLESEEAAATLSPCLPSSSYVYGTYMSY